MQTLSNDVQPLSNRWKCYFRGSTFQNFPGEACPWTPIDNLRHDGVYGVTWRDLYFKLAMPLAVLLLHLVHALQTSKIGLFPNLFKLRHNM